MAEIITFLEVDDVDQWLRSPKRQEILGPLGITGELFTDPANSNRVGMIANVPDMRFDGVRPETLVILARASDHL